MGLLIISAIIFDIIIVAILVAKVLNYKKTSYYEITKKNFLSLIQNRGDYGEYLTYRCLKSYEEKGAKFLFNVYIPRDKEETTEIDVLMISKSGIYVFESKNYSGWIFGDEERKTWTQTLPRGKTVRKEHFFNPIIQNSLHIKWLSSLLNDECLPIYSIIVFSERCELKNVNFNSTISNVVKRNRLFDLISSINETKEGLISEEKITEIYNRLYPYTQVTNEIKQEHIETIKEKHQTELGLCPKCGGKIVLRTVKSGEQKGTDFLGCSNYPKCRYTRNKIDS